ncbi:MAG: SAM-dependent methyltransferase, partial [Anaerolineae bacterium]|nr:SAM-dependent methyltransferase [Anaerolineae bacterium]
MYPLTLDLIDFLVSPPARQTLADLSGVDLDERQTLLLLTRLRVSFAPDEAAALLDQARLRRRAIDKFPNADRLLFTDEALQQASSRAVA